MHEPGAPGRGFLGQHAGGQRVDAVGRGHVALGLVDRRIGGGVDDQVGLDVGDRRAQRLGTRKIGIGTAERAQFAERRERALQLPADLAVFSKQENLHAWYCFSVHSR